MRCPTCDDVKMREVERGGVAIDICPECKGVWLDRGELEKMFAGEEAYYDERETGKAGGDTYDNKSRDKHERRDEVRHGDQHGGHSPKKKKGFLSNIMGMVESGGD